MKKTLLSLLGLTLFASLGFGQVDGASKARGVNADHSALSANVTETAAPPQLTEAQKNALDSNPVMEAQTPEADEAKVQPSAPDGTAVTVTATAGTVGPTNYATLKLAFDAINAGTHQGDITIAINANTTETASAVLNSGAVGPAAYTSVAIAPVGGARTITGNITGAVIKLNGADNVTIDGRIGGTGRNLTVSNSSTATATAAIWLASVAAGNGASNNVIRNLEIAAGTDSTAASTNASFGIAMCGITIGVTVNGVDNDNNSFIANRIIKARYGIMTRGTTTDLNVAPIVTDNIVGPSSFGTDQIGKVGIFMQADTGATVSRNTVQFVGCLDPQLCTGADRMGIAIGNESWSMAPGTITSNTYTVTNNVVHDIVDELTFSAMGINLATTGGGSATNNLVANNFIYNVRANGTAGDQAVGLGIAGGHTDTVAFNSISMTGDVDPGVSAASSNFGSGIRVANANGTTHLNLTLKNNSVYMDLSSSSGPTVRYYAISGNTNAYSFGTGGEDNNNLYLNPANTQLQTGGLGTVSGVTLTNQFATLANWQAAYTAAQDAASIQANPAYASITGDLHLVGGSPNIDAAAAIGAVTTDIDLQARPNGAGPDIGADEYYALPGDLQFSSVTYSGNEGTSPIITVNRVGGNAGTVSVDVTLADVSATGGAACGVGVDYVNPGVQTLTFTDGVTSQTFPVALCSDAVVDVNETFSLTLSNATGGAGIGAINPATMTIVDLPPPLSGSYNVPGDYASLTNAGGIFAALNVSGASGNVTINITADLAGEIGTVALNELSGGSSVTIKPSGAPRTIAGNSATQLIKLNGADNVTIDGSLAGGTDRSLTITNAAIGPIVWIATNATSGATGNTVKNCILSGPGSFTGQGIIAGSGTTLGNPAEFPNSNNTIQNNLINRVQNSAFISGNAPTGDSNWVVTGNTFGSTTVADKNSFRGMLMGGANNLVITNNTVMGVSSGPTSTASMSGIQLSALINGGLISGNKISDIKQNNPTGFGSQGIYLTSTSTASNVAVFNNFVSDVASQGTATTTALGNGWGLVVVSGGGYGFYYNSVSMNTNQVSASSVTAAVNIAAGLPAGSIDLVNNILSNTETVGTRYGVYNASTAAVFSTINYNDYFAQNVGFLGVAQPTLANWQTATAQDANSLAVDPGFVSATDLHITNASPVANLGLPVVGITTDIDGDTRNATTPDIGADEVTGAAPLSASSAVSRLTHGAAGPFDIALPLAGNPGIECRSTSGDYTVIVTFSNDVVSGSASVTTGTGSVSGSPAFSANTMTINLTGVTDVQQIAVTATNVTDVFAQVLPSTAIPMKVLIGDTNNNSAVNAGDVLQTRGRSGAAVDATTFRSDVNVNGSINAGDTLPVRSRSGNSLP